MPELPEVEIVGRNLWRWMAGRRIERVEPIREATFHDGSLELGLRVTGERVTSITRRGKVLWLETSGPVGWLMRFGMTGKWVQQTGLEPPRFTRVRVELDAGPALCMVDLRNLGGIWGVEREGGPARLQAWVPGRDPVLEGLTGEDLALRFHGRQVAIKTLLLDQSFVAGVGNIYASEALFRAGIHPLTPAGGLDAAGYDRLASAIVEILGWAITAEARDEVKYFGEAGAVNIFSVYQRTGSACSRCGGTIERQMIAARATFFCTTCQPAGGDSRLEKRAVR